MPAYSLETSGDDSDAESCVLESMHAHSNDAFELFDELAAPSLVEADMIAETEEEDIAQNDGLLDGNGHWTFQALSSEGAEMFRPLNVNMGSIDI